MTSRLSGLDGTNHDASQTPRRVKATAKLAFSDDTSKYTQNLIQSGPSTRIIILTQWPRMI